MTRTGFDLFNDLFFNDNFFQPLYSTARRTSSPATNVIEEDDAYKLQVSAPGFTKSDVDVKLDQDGNLVISLDKKCDNGSCDTPESEDKETTPESDSKEVAEVDTKPVHYLRREFYHQSSLQRFSLPEDADADSIKARMEDGILEVVIPKLKPEDQKSNERSISID